jgi:hypothetical protein
MRATEMIEERVAELKTIIDGNDGANAADARFSRAVDELLRSVYDGIGEIHCIPARALFDLFVIKVLYVERGSRHAGVVDYLGGMLATYVDVRELFPPDEHGRPRQMYFSDMLDPDRPPMVGGNIFDSYRKYADSALFLSGVFPARTRRSRPGGRTAMRRRPAPMVDREYCISTGKAMYRMAARDAHADCTHAPDTLGKLADHFEVYVDALNEMSERYVLGFDARLNTERMLDGYNGWRSVGVGGLVDEARRFAEILDIDPRRFARPDDRSPA